MALKVLPIDPAAHLETVDDLVQYLDAAMVGSDPKHIACALQDCVRSQGLSEMSDAFCEDDSLTLETLTAVLNALGLQLTVQKRSA